MEEDQVDAAEPVGQSGARAALVWVVAAVAALGAMAAAFFWMWTSFGERPPCEQLKHVRCPEGLSADEAAACDRAKGRWASEDETYCATGLDETRALRDLAWARSSERSRAEAEREERAALRQREPDAVTPPRARDPTKADRCMPILEECMAKCSPAYATAPESMAELEQRLARFRASGAEECAKACAASRGCQ
ncbi:MAG: hypothetical protein HYS27_11785 [Deltaproteobacteria bacterium]|nr:hypothetical protein [Deltaproteobacteria bacterium]